MPILAGGGVELRTLYRIGKLRGPGGVLSIVEIRRRLHSRHNRAGIKDDWRAILIRKFFKEQAR